MKAKNNRINPKMSAETAIFEMTDGNPGAMKALSKMLQANTEKGIMNIGLLDKFGIYGHNIYKLWNDCCDQDVNHFLQLLDEFREGKWTKDQINANLSRIRAQPFA